MKQKSFIKYPETDDSLRFENYSKKTNFLAFSNKLKHDRMFNSLVEWNNPLKNRILRFLPLFHSKPTIVH